MTCQIVWRSAILFVYKLVYKQETKNMTRKVYPSDVSREQFENIRPLLESARKRTKPRTVDLYDTFCGVLYVLRSGCQWAMLPSDFPKWRTVYNYWQLWSEPIAKHHQAIAPAHKPIPDASDTDPTSVLDLVLKKISWRGPHVPWSQLEHHFSDY